MPRRYAEIKRQVCATLLPVAVRSNTKWLLSLYSSFQHLSDSDKGKALGDIGVRISTSTLVDRTDLISSGAIFWLSII